MVHDETWSLQGYSQGQQLVTERPSLQQAVGALRAGTARECFLGLFPAMLTLKGRLYDQGLRLQRTQHDKALSPYIRGRHWLVLYERVSCSLAIVTPKYTSLN